MNGPAFMRALTDQKSLPAATFTKTLAMIFHAGSPDSKIDTSTKLKYRKSVISRKQSENYSQCLAIFNKKPAIASNLSHFPPFLSLFSLFL
jgi:hypothetical protein